MAPSSITLCFVIASLPTYSSDGLFLSFACEFIYPDCVSSFLSRLLGLFWYLECIVFNILYLNIK